MEITAAVVREAGQPFTIEQLELDDPQPGEVLVKIHAVGICHTDIAVQHQWLPVPLPLVLGHEGAGTVEAVGEGVARVVPGDKVVLTYGSCGHCQLCASGHPAYCLELVPRNVSGGRPDGSSALHSLDGDAVHGHFFSQSSFATHAIATERNVVKLADDADLTTAGPLGCGIQTGAGTVMNRLRPRAGSSLAVFGAGAVGLAALMAAKIVGCTTIVAVDIKPNRLEMAKELGATHVIDATSDADVVGSIQQITGIGVNYSIDTTAVPSVARQAVDALAPLGTCAIVGLGPAGTEVGIDMTGLLIPGRTVTGVTEGDSRPDEFIPQLLELHRQGRFPFDRLVGTYSLDEINEACEDSEAGRVIKPVLQLT